MERGSECEITQEIRLLFGQHFTEIFRKPVVTLLTDVFENFPIHVTEKIRKLHFFGSFTQLNLECWNKIHVEKQ